MIPMKQSREHLIQIDPAICHGQPVFAGTRILVSDVLELLEVGVSPPEIMSKKYFPRLTQRHIRAALHFVAEQLRNREFVAFAK